MSSSPAQNHNFVQPAYPDCYIPHAITNQVQMWHTDGQLQPPFSGYSGARNTTSISAPYESAFDSDNTGASGNYMLNRGTPAFAHGPTATHPRYGHMPEHTAPAQQQSPASAYATYTPTNNNVSYPAQGAPAMNFGDNPRCPVYNYGFQSQGASCPHEARLRMLMAQQDSSVHRNGNYAGSFSARRPVMPRSPYNGMTMQNQMNNHHDRAATHNGRDTPAIMGQGMATSSESSHDAAPNQHMLRGSSNNYSHSMHHPTGSNNGLQRHIPQNSGRRDGLSMQTPSRFPPALMPPPFEGGMQNECNARKCHGSPTHDMTPSGMPEGSMMLQQRPAHEETRGIMAGGMAGSMGGGTTGSMTAMAGSIDGSMADGMSNSVSNGMSNGMAAGMSNHQFALMPSTQNTGTRYRSSDTSYSPHGSRYWRF